MELIAIEFLRYLRRKGKGIVQKMIARFRCGNEEKANKYWLKEEERRWEEMDL